MITHHPFPIMTLREGDKAPSFVGTTQDGATLRLEDFKGKKIVLYFYPKDNTPGCTKQACNLRDHHTLLLKKGYVVIGVSNDSVSSHQRFSEKYQLPFPLIADSDRKITDMYGTSRTLWFPRRTTFLIDEKGYIKKIIDSVKASDHVAQILRLEEDKA